MTAKKTAKSAAKTAAVEADVADVTDKASCEAAAAAVLKAFGRIDTLVNNAGYGVPGRYLSADWKTHADFLQVLMTAVAELTYLFLPVMEAQKYGRILNVASLAGLVHASAGHTLYGLLGFLGATLIAFWNVATHPRRFRFNATVQDGILNAGEGKSHNILEAEAFTGAPV